jgi:hypothetical protein
MTADVDNWPIDVLKFVQEMDAKSLNSEAGKSKNFGAESAIISSTSLAEVSSSKSSTPTFQYLQAPPSPPALRIEAEDPPPPSNDGGILPTDAPLSESLPTQSGRDIELNDRSSREVNGSPPSDEDVGSNRIQSIRMRRPWCTFSLLLCGIAVFLAPVNIVSGMTASQGDNWKLSFVV